MLPALSAPLPGADVGRSWCGCGPVLVQMWAGPGSDVGRSWCRCGPILVRVWAGPGADVGRFVVFFSLPAPRRDYPSGLTVFRTVSCVPQHSGGGAALQVRTLAEAVFVEFVVRGKRRKQPVVRIVSAPTVPSPPLPRPLPALPPPRPHRFILPRTSRQLCLARAVSSAMRLQCSIYKPLAILKKREISVLGAGHRVPPRRTRREAVVCE